MRFIACDSAHTVYGISEVLCGQSVSSRISRLDQCRR
jgi:hypothetical protein